ncbi:hypothetical protein SK128_017560 [Halocaridina rubra]|uniref:NBAS subunit of NRZ tethering complex C-terminal domain-containing protein n=1 Tax=Halocaridina rubra TaxID=373956 RepID=A0AAN8X078_HALRR
MTQYYYALQIYTSLYPWTKPCIAPVLLHNPLDVIECVSKLIDKQIYDTQNPEILRFIEFFKSSRELVADYVQGQALQRLGTGVDIDRFLSDSSYKEDTVLGLAMTLDSEVLDLAITLAHKYDVSLWQVYMTHLQHLFDSEITTAQVRKHIEERKILKTLGKEPKDFVARMEQNVYLTVNGCDHERLLLYYSLIEQCGEKQDSQMATSHIKLLKKLKGSAKDLNYKMLLKPDSDILALLRPVLTADNVKSLAKVAKSVPCKEGDGIEQSTVYCAWAQKYFFNPPSDKKPRTSSDWIHRYELCGEYMQKMNAEDVLKFVSQLVLSGEGSQSVPLEARMEITQKVVVFCQEQKKQKEGDETNVWEETAMKVERWGTHLGLLRSSTFQKLHSSNDPLLKQYANRFALTGSSQGPLRELACSVLLEKSGLDALQEILSVYPEDSVTTPEDVIMDTLRQLVAHWKREKTEVQVTAKGRDLLVILDHILGEVEKYINGGGDLLSEEEVLDELRTLCEDANVSLQLRVDVLTVAGKHLSMSEEDFQLGRVMRTGGIVGDEWPNVNISVQPDQLASAASRASLLNNLLTETSSLSQVEAMITLLNLWPPFCPEEYENLSTNPWMMIFTKALEILSTNPAAGMEVIWEAAQVAVKQNQLPGESIALLVRKLQALGRSALKFCFKMALLSEDEEVHIVVLNVLRDIEEITEADYDNYLLECIIAKNLVADVLPTHLYGPLVSYLIEAAKKPSVSSAIQQLQRAGYHQEAASLASTQSSIPKLLQNVSSMLKTYKKWL